MKMARDGVKNASLSKRKNKSLSPTALLWEQKQRDRNFVNYGVVVVVVRVRACLNF